MLMRGGRIGATLEPTPLRDGMISDPERRHECRYQGSGISWHAHKPSACSDYSTETVFAKGDFGRNPMVEGAARRFRRVLSWGVGVLCSITS